MSGLINDKLHQAGDRSLGQGGDVGREDSHVKGPDHSQSQGNHCGRRTLKAGDLPPGLPGIHENGGSKIVIDGDRALEDGGYWIECPELPGCSSQGDSVEEALDMIKDAIKGHLAVDEELKKERSAKRKAT